MNKDLIEISKWVNQCKMSFNPDMTKQAYEVIFSRKSKKTDHPTVYLIKLQYHTLIATSTLECTLKKN